MATVTATKRVKFSKQKKKLSYKQKLVQLSAQQRQKVQEQAFEWQEQLFSQSAVSIDLLQQAALWLQPQTYDEVVEERNVQSFCGYPLCSRQPKIQSKYRISLSQRKVFDQSELSNYCSTACLQKSKYYTMQLSEDPVWIRDFNIPSTIHVISMEENFSKVISEQQNRNQKNLSDHDIREVYVKKLLSNVPIGNNNHHKPESTDTDDKFEITIIENNTNDAIKLPVQGIHDAIEGFRIDISRKDTKKPTTIVLNQSKGSATTTTTNQFPISNTTSTLATTTKDDTLDTDSSEYNPDALLDEAMETMKMLKQLELEENNTNNQEDTTEKNEEVSNVNKQNTNNTNDDNNCDKDKNSHFTSNKSNDCIEDDSIKQNKTINKPLNSDNSSMTMLTTVSTNDTIPAITEPSSSQVSNVIQVKANAQSTTSTTNTTTTASTKQLKKKKKEPEMSLFGKIWTLLDRMTTKATRQFLASLNNGGDLTLLNENVSNNADILRGQIFSEKVLEMYGVIRSQMGIKGEIELDIVNLIRTFHFAEASMVVLDPEQTYMLTLVLFKSLAPDLLTKDDDWNEQFKSCCVYIGQSPDMIDACVRVLKVAST